MVEPVKVASLSEVTSDHADLPQDEVAGLNGNKLPYMAVVGSFVLLFFGSLYIARDFFMPVILALLFALTLSPIVRFLSRRGIAPGVSSFIILALIIAGLVTSVYLLTGPAQQWLADAPEMGEKIKQRLQEIREPVQAVVEASEQVDDVTKAGSDNPSVQEVTLKQPGLLTNAMSGVGRFLTTLAVTLILMFFLLASGDLFYEKAIRAVPTFSDKKRVLRIVYDIEREVSGYLFTVFLINAGLGAVITIGMYALGMPSFYLWGIAAALLNFIPYIGSVIGVALVAAVALVSFDSLGQALLVPGFYLMTTILEGQFVTPLLLGRRLELNAVAIFIAVALWTWLWGFIGALIAVPLLVMTKVFCDHFESLAAFGDFLSARRPVDDVEV